MLKSEEGEGEKKNKVQMKVLFWNIRGIRAKGRSKQLMDMVAEQHIDLVCLQETMKEGFTDKELIALCENCFTWHYSAARGRSGGMLIGLKEDQLEVLSVEIGEFFMSLVMIQRKDQFTWEVINVYGPAKQSKRRIFLEELNQKLDKGVLPVLIGGDFNLYRFSNEKSRGKVDIHRMEDFNKFVADHELIELHRLGQKFTWTNKQICPIRVVLDRVFVNKEWELKYPLTIVTSLLRVGSDHCPIMLDTKKEERRVARQFKFEMSWFLVPHFKEMICKRWPKRFQLKAIDFWHYAAPDLRRMLRGWKANLGKESKEKRLLLEQRLIDIDSKADESDLFEQEWEERYKIEEELENIYAQEEIMWQRRSGETWLIKGDSNTGYYHGIANGRRRKYYIFSLQKGDQIISQFKDIQNHVYEYYKSLFGKETLIGVSLADNAWREKLRLSEEDREKLTRDFGMEELERVIKDIKSNTAPGPDGFPIGFFKNMWSMLKGLIKELLDDMCKGELDLGRLNYGVISLLPKIKEANAIRQCRPICLLNVILKILTKAVTMRATEIAGKVISRTQTAFIPGRSILEGVVVLHEVLHELKSKGERGIIFKIDFEKTYDRVQWPFLVEVMRKKNFGEKFIGWIINAVEGGRVAININGEQGEFFRTYRGLRQGDPLSPILFNLVGDALDLILESAKKAGVLEGLTPNLIEGGITHLQYADDTILFVKPSRQNIATLKFLMFCFEEMSGMKINYQKSKVFGVGLEDGEL